MFGQYPFIVGDENFKILAAEGNIIGKLWREP
jgi:hypothetical protein